MTNKQEARVDGGQPSANSPAGSTASNRWADPALMLAEAIAATAHAGDVDKNGDSYILHPARVAVGVTGRLARQVAWLHDVCEDHPTFWREVKWLLDPEVVKAVEIVSRMQGEPYGDFIMRVIGSRNPIAIAVKLADVRDNYDRLHRLDDETAARLRIKYQPAIKALERAQAGDAVDPVLSARGTDSGPRATATPTPAPHQEQPDLRTLTFAEFSAVNRKRCESPDGFNHQLASWSTSDWFTAVMGELGEAANVAKKLNRIRDGIPGNKETEAALRDELRKELGDTFVYLDLLCQLHGFNIGSAAAEVFNAKSEQIGCPIRLADALKAQEGRQDQHQTDTRVDSRCASTVALPHGTNKPTPAENCYRCDGDGFDGIRNCPRCGGGGKERTE